jgi:hypothetical protein
LERRNASLARRTFIAHLDYIMPPKAQAIPKSPHAVAGSGGLLVPNDSGDSDVEEDEGGDELGEGSVEGDGLDKLYDRQIINKTFHQIYDRQIFLWGFLKKI